jgi:acyl-CoA thioester hydrolase
MNDVDLTARTGYPTWTTDTIRYSDLDPNGHVNNGAINAYFEDGRVRFRNEHLVSIGDDILTGFVLVSFSVRYLAQLHYPGNADIGTRVLHIGGSSYTLGQGLFEGERCVATAEVVTVRIDPETGRSAPLSDELRQALTRAG